MAIALLVDAGPKSLGQFWRIVLVARIADRARRASRTAFASVLAEPWSLEMNFAEPVAIVAAQASHGCIRNSKGAAFPQPPAGKFVGDEKPRRHWPNLMLFTVHMGSEEIRCSKDGITLTGGLKARGQARRHFCHCVHFCTFRLEPESWFRNLTGAGLDHRVLSNRVRETLSRASSSIGAAQDGKDNF